MPDNPFAARLAAHTGINTLMDDLAKGTRSDAIMLGGGNPGFVPKVLERLRDLLHQTTTDSIQSLLGEYAEPLGDTEFRCALARLFNSSYGWKLTEANIALCNGSQSGFFTLFNLLAGDHKKILLPLLPEYIGYTQLGLHPSLLTGIPANTQIHDDQEFIYTPDFEAIDLTDVAAMCVSRPSNPSGKVLTDSEIAILRQLCARSGIPLIIDNAYGNPFPGIIFSDYGLPWGEDIILTFSLSKLGMPAARTGIIVADESRIAQIGRINAVTALAPTATAARLITPLCDSGEIITLSRDHIRPFYHQRATAATSLLKELLHTLPCKLHRVDGGIFLWLWMPELPISSVELYQRCKARGVIVVPGCHFFPGMTEGINQHQCIRISYAGEPQILAEGLALIADEIHRTYAHQPPAR